MFWGWLKGILSSILVFVGILFIVYGFYLLGEDNGIGGAISLVIGLIMSVVGSYLKYVSKQTVKPTKKYFIIFFICVIFTFYLFETYLLIKEKNVITFKTKIYNENTGKKYDLRSKFEIYQDLKKEERNISLSYSAWNLGLIGDKNFHPLSGLSNTKSIHCNENGYYSIYLSDRFGFNNPDSEWDRDQIEYLLVGDSFVHGACVNRPNDISSVLRTLSGKGVLNLGISGNGPLNEYATLREYIKPNIKKIIWVYYEGYDLLDLMAERNNNIFRKYIEDINFSQNLIYKQKTKNQTIKKIIDQEANRISKQLEKDNNLKYKILKFIRLDKTKKSIFFKPSSETIDNSVFTDFEEVIKLAKELSLKNNSKFYFVYLPEYYRYTTKYSNQNYKKVLSILEKLNISVINIHEDIFAKEQNPLKFFPFQMDGHFNILGNKKVSEVIYQNTQ
tara:strand:- start:49 stop:1386 length:1338 start_codon:yes stop_codon:yes gene_type:complete